MANRNVGIIGCEPFINGVAKLLRAVETEQLDNIRILNGDARQLLDTLGNGSIARTFLLYPDPWPKKRHHKRRFVNQWSLGELHRVMTPGSQLRIASDIPDYIEWTLCEIRQFGGFEWAAQTRDDWNRRGEDWPGTRYEQKALREERTPAYLTFLRSE